MKGGTDRRMNQNLTRHILFCLLLLSFPSIAWAAINPWPSGGGETSESPPSTPAATALTDAEIDKVKAKLESRLVELHLQMLPEAIASFHATYRDVATPRELLEWERLTNRLAGILDGHINSLIRLRNIRKTNQDRTVEMKRWQGFTEKPPYPISLLDSLNDAINAKQIDQQIVAAHDFLVKRHGGTFDLFRRGDNVENVVHVSRLFEVDAHVAHDEGKTRRLFLGLLEERGPGRSRHGRGAPRPRTALSWRDSTCRWVQASGAKRK